MRMISSSTFNRPFRSVLCGGSKEESKQSSDRFEERNLMWLVLRVAAHDSAMRYWTNLEIRLPLRKYDDCWLESWAFNSQMKLLMDSSCWSERMK
ncbi:hypothetical protein Mp_8g00490 [Marchantia polymorpha subsp. ruderalis]|uniref:Uncharacterized protein n=1 Tax=Marchantia polymorpha TaxID=3197 RepID=A0A2R6WLJ5_MARPO|nr:hypothetical protein MARPO_0077s0023 [Marchantia polymorpha]BBN18191.1 hypothetical protein Mp_8g00490 [Marchantia polymorpha subsp. ruderalis]|eukprot:PTQ34693.1 hypothetical protein MARPO_0077s0023 [Marchantia polymorpha]